MATRLRQRVGHPFAVRPLEELAATVQQPSLQRAPGQFAEASLRVDVPHGRRAASHLQQDAVRLPGVDCADVLAGVEEDPDVGRVAPVVFGQMADRERVEQEIRLALVVVHDVPRGGERTAGLGSSIGFRAHPGAKSMASSLSVVG